MPISDYSPVSSTDEKRYTDDDDQQQAFLHPSLRRVLPQSSRFTRLANYIHIMILYFGLLLLLVALATEPQWRHCSCDDPSIGFYSPAQESVVYEDVEFGKYFAADNKSPYTEKPSPEIDAMWRELYSFGLTGLTEDEASLLQEPTAHLPHDNSTYVVSLGVFHQIHCVNHLRKALYPDEYPGLWEYNEDGTVDHNTILALHWDHCIDMLRQTLMCHADITPTPFYYRARDDNIYSTLATTHHCRNFDNVREWARDRQLQPWRWNETGTQQHIG